MSGILRTTNHIQPTFAHSRGLFLRLLAVVYFIAFASLTPQIHALIGAEGLLPAETFFDRAYEIWGLEAYYQLPSLVWLWPNDAFLTLICWFGIVLSIAGIAGVVPILTFAILWICYLSLTVAGQDFLSFQWDVLLLETGLLAIVYSPNQCRLSFATHTEPSKAGRWLIWSLAFKLTFLSGITKLLSGDETWWNLTALSYHFETQPLPTWTSWYAHAIPDWFGGISVGSMFIIELIVPFVIFVPTRYRLVRTIGCGLLCLLQILIAFTGNYGFFNILTTVLYLALLDDNSIASIFPRIGTRNQPSIPKPTPIWTQVSIGFVAVVLGTLSMLTLLREVRRPEPIPEWSASVLSWVAPVRSINGYGLFRSMTTERREITIEGSIDGQIWTEYPFRWKPGDLSLSPRFVQPHMPRLDWQMWFAALSPEREAHWLFPLVTRLLESSSPILALLDENPFPEENPRFLRLVMYRYHFTNPDPSKSENWWRREFLGYLTEPISAPLK